MSLAVRLLPALQRTNPPTYADEALDSADDGRQEGKALYLQNGHFNSSEAEELKISLHVVNIFSKTEMLKAFKKMILQVQARSSMNLLIVQVSGV